MNFLKLLKITDAITFCNVIIAMLAMVYAITGKTGIAAILIMVSVLFDYSDGAWSRRLNIVNEFGRELDSLADVICFGVAPAIFAFTLYGNANYIPVYALFLAAGVMRLARHNITRPEGYFEGMPITVNGILVPILYYCGAHPFVMHGYLIASAVLMASSIRVPKIKIAAKNDTEP